MSKQNILKTVVAIIHKNKHKWPAIMKGSGYRSACGSWNVKNYSYAACDVTVTHNESAVGLVETN